MEGNIEQQITSLERQIEEKKMELENKEGSSRSEKEIVHSIVGEHIQQQAPSHPVKTGPTAGSYQDPDLQPLVQNLVNIAFTKGIPDAIKEAVKLDSPALLDAFHDILVDELYTQLIERKRLKEVK